jgi:3-deoxy-manno-octulosonate cytidylyltransferase (CMP-KDO synthetase)
VSGRVLGVIPARLASTRLLEKPLHPILGRPLIEWVWRRVSNMSVLDAAVVATDSDRVAAVCRALEAPVVLTSPDHPSGTDRVAEVARRPEFSDYGCVVNIQGDEPLIDGEAVSEVVALIQEAGWDVGTCAAPVRDSESFHDPSVVKVARACDGRALYFSRAPIPARRDGPPSDDDFSGACFLRHVGLYAYTREALERWVELTPSPLEKIEQLEQLRALEAGIRIGVAVVERANPGVDTPGDVARVERQLSAAGAHTQE